MPVASTGPMPISTGEEAWRRTGEVATNGDVEPSGVGEVEREASWCSAPKISREMRRAGPGRSSEGDEVRPGEERPFGGGCRRRG